MATKIILVSGTEYIVQETAEEIYHKAPSVGELVDLTLTTGETVSIDVTSIVSKQEI